MSNREKAEQLVKFVDNMFEGEKPENINKYLLYYDEEDHIPALVLEYKRLRVTLEQVREEFNRAYNAISNSTDDGSWWYEQQLDRLHELLNGGGE